MSGKGAFVPPEIQAAIEQGLPVSPAPTLTPAQAQAAAKAAQKKADAPAAPAMPAPKPTPKPKPKATPAPKPTPTRTAKAKPAPVPKAAEPTTVLKPVQVRLSESDQIAFKPGYHFVAGSDRETIAKLASKGGSLKALWAACAKAKMVAYEGKIRDMIRAGILIRKAAK